MNLLLHFISNPISLFRYLTLDGKYRFNLKQFLKYNFKNASRISKKISKKESETVDFTFKGETITMRNEPGAVYYITEGVEKLYKLVSQIELPPNATIIDAGGNVGLFSYFLKKRYPDAKVIIIEPSKSLIPIIKKNLEKWEKDITIIPKALTDKDGIVTFFINKGAEQTNSIDINAVTPFAKKNEDIIQYDVPSITLTSVIKEHHLSKVDLLKLDIQGSEYSVLQSSIDTFKMIDSMLVEICFVMDDSVDLCAFVANHYPKNKVIGEVTMGGDVLFSR